MHSFTVYIQLFHPQIVIEVSEALGGAHDPSDTQLLERHNVFLFHVLWGEDGKLMYELMTKTIVNGDKC